MKRFFDKVNKKEYFIGKPIKLSYTDDHNNSVQIESNILTPDLASYLVARNILVVMDKEEPSVPEDLNFYIEKFGKKIGISGEDSHTLLSLINTYSPSTVWSILIKQIALELDKKYSNHIKDSEHIFAISNINGKIAEVPKSQIRSYRNFAAFRTVEDAVFAIRLTRNIMKTMFSNAK